MLLKIKNITLKIFLLVVSIFYTLTNGIALFLTIKGLIELIPKVYKLYNTTGTSGKFIFYLVVTIIVFRFFIFFLKYFILAVKTLFLTIFDK